MPYHRQKSISPDTTDITYHMVGVCVVTSTEESDKFKGKCAALISALAVLERLEQSTNIGIRASSKKFLEITFPILEKHLKFHGIDPIIVCEKTPQPFFIGLIKHWKLILTLAAI